MGSSLLSGVGKTPKLSWTAPTLGTASRYYVFVDLVSSQGGSSALDHFATIETTDTQATIPPGLLQTGQTYVFEIEARAAAGLDLSATPNAYALPEGYGTVTTTMVTP